MGFRDDQEIIDTFILETADHLDEIEYGILRLENAGTAIDEEKVHALFRAAHSIKAGANLLDCVNIEKVAHTMENILQQLRLKQTEFSSDAVSTMLQAIDTMREMAEDPLRSDRISVTALLERLKNVMT